MFELFDHYFQFAFSLYIYRCKCTKKRQMVLISHLITVIKGV